MTWSSIVQILIKAFADLFAVLQDLAWAKGQKLWYGGGHIFELSRWVIFAEPHLGNI